MAPKSWAITHPETALQFIAVPARGFVWIFRPLLKWINVMANKMVSLAGEEPVDRAGAAGYDAETLRTLVEHSRETGALDDESANYNVTFAPGTLTVAPASLRDASRVSVGQVDPVVYNGRAHAVAESDIQVTDVKAGASSASPLSESDYDVTVAGDATNAGTARAVVTGIGNYTGSVVRKLEILPAELTIKTPSAAGRHTSRHPGRLRQGSRCRSPRP